MGCSSRAALVVAADEDCEAGRNFGAEEVLGKCTHLLVPARGENSGATARWGSSLVRARHAAEVVRAAHRLEIAAYKQQLHLGESQEAS